MWKKKFYMHKMRTDPTFVMGSSTYMKMLMEKMKADASQDQKVNHFQKRKQSTSVELIQIALQKEEA
jgi:hypothetical protein